MNLTDYIILGIVLVLLALAIIYMARQKKKGKCLSCTSCPYSAGCDKKKTDGTS